MPTRWVIRQPEQFAVMIREARQQAGLTQVQLAERSDLHRTYLSSLERGQRSPAIRIVLRLLAVLGLDLVVLERRSRG